MRYLHMAVLAAGLMSTSAHAAILFDFEGTSTTTGGALTSLTQSAGGLSVTFTRPNSSFDIRDISAVGGGGPPSFGNRTLSPFANQTSATPFFATFSKGLSQLSFQAGDYGADSDVISLVAFSGANGTGSVVGSDVVDYGLGSFPTDVATLSVSSSTAFRSVEFIGGSPNFPNSVYYDNFSASVSGVPLPASAPMFGAAVLALGAVGYCMKRKKAAAAA